MCLRCTSTAKDPVERETRFDYTGMQNMSNSSTPIYANRDAKICNKNGNQGPPASYSHMQGSITGCAPTGP